MVDATKLDISDLELDMESKAILAIHDRIRQMEYAKVPVLDLYQVTYYRDAFIEVGYFYYVSRDGQIQRGNQFTRTLGLPEGAAQGTLRPKQP